MRFGHKIRARLSLPLALACCFSIALAAPFSSPSSAKPAAGKAPPKAKLDHSGKPRKGKASYYGREFAGRPMANGEPMNPQSNAAASKTLPLGTKAKVTNLRNGKSSVVEIKDRGPYVDGRIIDVTPKTARKLGMETEGVVPVEVVPLEVPQPDGSVKLGAAATKEAVGQSEE
ncbi:MAG TPA: septal ring lytic transglycosylase RlpA family protein [Burkholderiaceae bacterium]|nr:septal ring lytic transglycosylase RlpA family protein [Burkholderiaceae bacterium]